MLKTESLNTQKPLRLSGPASWHPLGLLPQIQADPLVTLRQIADNYNGFARFRVGLWETILVAHPDPVREILRDRQRSFSKNTFTYGMVRSIGGPGLLTLSGDEWQPRRRLMQPIFSKTRIERLDALMSDAALRMLERWQPMADSGQEVDVATAMNELTLDIAAKAFFDVDIDSGRELRAATNAQSEAFTARVRSPLATIWGLAGLPSAGNAKLREAQQVLEETVQQIIAEMRSSSSDADNLVIQLAQATDEETGAGLSESELQTEVLTLLIAGHETSARLLTWALYLLSRHEDALARLHTEVKSQLQGRLPTAADVAQLPYLNQVINEALRLYPSAWAFSRMTEADETICDYQISKGARLLISPYLLHRHPEFWPDPDRFDPDRFSHNTKEAIPSHAFIPFGAGPRQCIGKRFALLEAQLVLAMIASRFSLQAASSEVIEAEVGATLAPQSPIRITLQSA